MRCCKEVKGYGLRRRDRRKERERERERGKRGRESESIEYKDRAAVSSR